MRSQSAPFLSPRLFAPNNILPRPPIDAFSAPLLCQFRPLQHSNYTSEYTHRMRRVWQAGWPHVRRGTVENWCRIQQRGWLAPPRRGREESLGCVVHGDAAPRLENHNRSSAARSKAGAAPAPNN